MMALPRSRALRIAAAAALFAIGALFPACDSDNPRTGGPRLEAVKGRVTHPALEGTIGEIAVFADSSGLLVQGYGTVGGLPNTGSREMPAAVREILEEQLYHRGAGSAGAGTTDFSPKSILNTNQISAVEVRGMIPPLARKGTTFDLYITALAGSQTTSLNRGVLWAADLKAIGGILSYDALPGGGMADSHTIATGEGPVYCTPDVESSNSPAPRRDFRSAVIINGGVVQEERPIRLQLYSPSYHWTKQIERSVIARWNTREEQYANAENDLVVSLRIPPQYQQNPKAFVDLVLHLYLRQDVPGYAINKARELVSALADPRAPHRELSLALQGIGRSVLDSVLRPAYTSPNPHVRFYTAKAGAMLLDSEAMVVLQTFAETKGSPFQAEAIRTIADAAGMSYSAGATACLSRLLDWDDNAIRITAYEALVNMRSPAVKSGYVGRNFILDVVPSRGQPLVYAMQSSQRRIALIGMPIIIPPETLYLSRDRTLSVNAIEARSEDLAAVATEPGNVTPIDRKQSVTIYSRNRLTGKTVTLITANSLAAVISKLGAMPNPSRDFNPHAVYIGASYQQVIEMIGSMAKDKLLPVTFVLQVPPRPILSPAEILAGGRPDRNPENIIDPSTQPATLPSPSALR